MSQLITGFLPESQAMSLPTGAACLVSSIVSPAFSDALLYLYDGEAPRVWPLESSSVPFRLLFGTCPGHRSD